MIELHCPVILRYYDESINDFRFLIAKRYNRKIFDNKWEFGAAKPKENESIINTIKREYKKDFNVDIKLDTDSLGYPIPIGIYEADRYYNLDKIIKGIIFSGQIISDINDIRILEKHSEYKLASIEEIEKISIDDCVPGLLDHVNIVKTKIN